MMMNTDAVKTKATFVAPTAQIVLFAAEDVIRTSGGGFEGEWDDF